ncbi:uncharacterized protein EI97DRAFT_212252 [Westerdykella ornata]|uniref:CENP-V/GFA domain-containing protein n=1 Tax=Westerdykella ornata TaxID=318751 RepID=A0A6A6J876_WESOR|nr:uncharacterized protein EI97DRAFT_212252 [Westerdykella ornata]KAF2272363.1 hypothetical protein EI97DRAFT_212252 [Westerdykella ornata]
MTPPPRPPPNHISGSCLCRSITYTLSFPSDSTPWPPTVQSCQCTMCRKHTASLLPIFLVLRPSSGQIAPWPLDAERHLGKNTTYTEYASSENGLRGFCSRCGSSLLFRNRRQDAGDQKERESQETMDLFVGTLDEKWLVDDREMAKALATPNELQFWCKHAVQGVTDVVRGGTRLETVRGTEMD